MLLWQFLLCVSSAAALSTSEVHRVPDHQHAPFSSATEAHHHQRELNSHVYHGGPGTGSTYGQRNKNSWMLFLVGVALLFISPMVLIGTELQGVRFARLLNRGRQSTLSNVPSASITAQFEGHMIHTLGPISVGGGSMYTDNETGVSFGGTAAYSAQVSPANFKFPLLGGGGDTPVPSNPMRLQRTIEVFSWVERQEQDSQETRHVYDQVWTESDVDSSAFAYRQGHENPQRVVELHSSDTIDRPDICLGAFELGPAAIEKAHWWSPCLVHPSTQLSSAFTGKEARVIDGVIIVPGPPLPTDALPPPIDPATGQPLVGPKIGDVKISYHTVEIPGGNSTIIGVQQGSTLRPYTAADAAKTLGMSDRKQEALRTETGRSEGDVESQVEGLEAKLDGANCCKTFAVLTGLFSKVMALVMAKVIGTDVLLLQPQGLGVTSMFAREEIRIEAALSIFRFLGTVGFIAAFYFILHPIAALFSFVPFLSHMISSLFLFAAVIIGFTCAMTTTALTWLYAKPLRGFILFVLFDVAYAATVYLDGASVAPLFFFSAGVVPGMEYPYALSGGMCGAHFSVIPASIGHCL